MSKNISSMLRDYISQQIKDGKIDPVLRKKLLRYLVDIDQGIATKNNKKVVWAIQEMCNELLNND